MTADNKKAPAGVDGEGPEGSAPGDAARTDALPDIVSPEPDEARVFLERLGGGRFGFQPYTDDETGPKPDPDPFLRPDYRRHGYFTDLVDELVRFNDAGAAIAPIVNELDGKGFRTEHVARVRAVFADLDLPAQDAVSALHRATDSELPPTMAVQSSLVRFHLYWVLNDDLSLERFGDVQRALAERYGGDPQVANLNRAMRLPGFVHRKDPARPFRSRLVYVSERRYAASELLAAFLPADAGTPSPAAAPAPAEFDAALLEDALGAIPADDRETYVTVIRAVKLSAEEAGFPEESAKEIVRAWAKTSPKYEEREFEKRWEKDFKRAGGKVQRLGTVFKAATDYGWRRPDKLTVDDFYAYMPMHNYIYAPTRETWPASSVNARVPKVTTPGGPVEPATWIDRHRAVEQLTWSPGEPELVKDRLLAEGGWIDRVGAKVFNLYRPPAPPTGDPAQADPWREHLAKLYPEEHAHIERWLAHRVQHPGEKINHGIVLGGAPGIGKDTLLVPVRRAVGFWNMQEVSPVQIVGRFNGFLKSVVLRVSEARDLGGNDMSATNRYMLHEHMKTFTAEPPEVLRIDEKHLREYYVPNVLGVVVTTNYQDGMYLPPDDRRFFVAWSELTSDDFPTGYWQELYGWYENGGAEHVAAHLATLDLSEFGPKARPPWTAAKAAMVDAGQDPETSMFADALDKMDNPNAVVLAELAAWGDDELEMLLSDKKNARRVPKLLEEVGYVRTVNPGDKTGKWKIGGKRQTIYAKRELSERDRIAAARAVTHTELRTGQTTFPGQE